MTCAYSVHVDMKARTTARSSATGLGQAKASSVKPHTLLRESCRGTSQQKNQVLKGIGADEEHAYRIALKTIALPLDPALVASERFVTGRDGGISTLPPFVAPVLLRLTR